MMADKTHIVILRETFWQSLGSDAVTLATCLALIAPGLWLDSSALQWTGSVMFSLVVLTKASTAGRRKTIAEARAYLDQIEAGE